MIRNSKWRRETGGLAETPPATEEPASRRQTRTTESSLDQMGLDSAILRIVGVGDERLRLSEALGDQQGRIEPLRRKVGDDRSGAALRKTQIILLGAGGVGVAVDLELLPFQPRILERLGELAEVFPGRLGQFGGIELEIDQKIEVRLRRRLRGRTVRGGSDTDRPRPVRGLV